MKGDFIGFTFNNRHSSEMGIVRTSNGSRFEKNLLPNFQDKIISIPGGDGSYYFGTDFKQKNINVPIAFDDLDEYQFSKLNEWVGEKKLAKLIFDETPYKYYYAKISGTPTLKYICFDDETTEEGNIKRVYKGEGSLNFVVPEGIGHNEYETAEDLFKTNNPLIIESYSQNVYQRGDIYYPLPRNSASLTQNCGDLPCDYQVIIERANNEEVAIKKEGIINILTNTKDWPSNVNAICIDSKTQNVYNYVNGEIKEILSPSLLSCRVLEKIPVGLLALEKGTENSKIKMIYNYH